MTETSFGSREIELLVAVFDHAIREHPLPWRVDPDWVLGEWVYNVTASDNAYIAKLRDKISASGLISIAERRKEEIDRKATYINDHIVDVG